jgi:hypothetical protein
MYVLAAHTAFGADRVFDLAVRIHPEDCAAVILFGDTFPFTASTQSEADGRFRFSKLRGRMRFSIRIAGRRGRLSE